MLPVLEFEVEATLRPQDKQVLLLHRLGLVQGDLEVSEDVSQYHLLLIQSKLLTNTVPAHTSHDSHMTGQAGGGCVILTLGQQRMGRRRENVVLWIFQG